MTRLVRVELSLSGTALDDELDESMLGMSDEELAEEFRTNFIDNVARNVFDREGDTYDVQFKVTTVKE